MAEQPSRKRRIVRRALLAVAGAVLLGYVYVASYFAVAWASHRDFIPQWEVVSVYKPLNKYSRSDLIGSGQFRAIYYWVVNSDPNFMRAYEGQMQREAERLLKRQQESGVSSDATPPVTAAETLSD